MTLPALLLFLVHTSVVTAVAAPPDVNHISASRPAVIASENKGAIPNPWQLFDPNHTLATGVASDYSSHSSGQIRQDRQGGEDEDSAVLLDDLPIILTGTTAGFADDYSPLCAETSLSPDVVYLLQPANNQWLEFSLCAGTAYASVLALYRGAIQADSLQHCDQSSCSNERSLIRTQLLADHNYYLLVDGAADESGAYTLSVWSPCDSVSELPCETDVVISDSLTGNAWQNYCQENETGPEQVWQFSFAGGLLEADLRANNSQDHDLILLSDCDPASCLQMPFQSGNTEVLSNLFPAGDYFLVVDIWNWNGHGEAAQGLDYSLNLHCETQPCSDDPPFICVAPPEQEPNGGWNDDNQFYNELACGDSLCGSLWTSNGERDLDWFRIEHTGGPLHISVDSRQLNPILFLTDFALPEQGGVTLHSRDRRPFCEGEELNLEFLEAGTYYAVVSHNALQGVPVAQPYVIRMSCPADPCLAHEFPECTGQTEVEPNDGWNSANQNWDLWPGQNPVCGTLSVDNDSRDTDWYRFSLQDSSAVSMQVTVDEFDPILFLADVALPPAGVIHAGADNFRNCQAESLHVACLPPGEYYAMVAPNAATLLPTPEEYALELWITPIVQCPDPCSNGVTITADMLPWQENRPAPQTANQQRPWLCDEINSAGFDDVYTLELSSAMELRITMLAEGAWSDEVILLLDQCGEAASCIAVADDNGPGEQGETLTTALLEAGSYTLVADFWGSLESHAYTLEILPLTAITTESPAVPKQFELQISPNPFNPTTRLQWQHPGGSAELRIWSLSGQEVWREQLGPISAGLAQWTFSGAKLASGLYLLQLSSSHGDVFTGKALLLK